jgi:glycerol-3-phosphate dehydrogenase
MPFQRDHIISKLENPEIQWDMVIIGGGASGLGAALESVMRGYRTLLLEQHDIAKGTSSRSTKLVHGGVRYLAQGRIPLVIEALRERGRLKQNAPHLVRRQGFVIPCYSWWSVLFYTSGLILYDLLAGRYGIGRSAPLSKQKTLEALPTIKQDGLRGGVIYYDYQFDDSRLAINLCQTIQELGGVVLNYVRVTGILKDKGRVSGVLARDGETGRDYEIRSKGVINATGVFVDQILKMDDPRAKDVVKPSQGTHLVLDRKFLNGSEALMIPKTSDGRVIFIVPWHGKVVVGTTDVEKHVALLEPCPEEEEVDYILETAGRYLDPPPEKKDVLSVFTGLRPLAAPSGKGQKTKEISRGHKILVSQSGLVSITGGKWTIYRKMAEDVVKRVARGRLPYGCKPVTASLKIHGHDETVDPLDPYYWYGSDRRKLTGLIAEDPDLAELLSTELSIIKAQVIWAVREEMARTVEDFLARRTRAIQLDAAESIRVAPLVAEIMAAELGFDKTWEKGQLRDFTRVAQCHLLAC